MCKLCVNDSNERLLSMLMLITNNFLLKEIIVVHVPLPRTDRTGERSIRLSGHLFQKCPQEYISLSCFNFEQ